MLYVSDTELVEFLGLDSVGALPVGWQRMVRRASGLVADATAAARYRTTTGGFPADPRKREAMRDATAQMVEDWTLAKVDPALGVAQLPRRAASKSALGVSVTYEQNGAQGALERLARGDSLTPTALGFLSRAGLISATVQVAGSPAPEYIPDADELERRIQAHIASDDPHPVFDSEPSPATIFEEGIL